MNWKEWLKFDPYRKLWSLVGKRPWTYIYRDIWHNVEILMQVQWFWAAVLVLWVMGVSIPLRGLLVGWAIYILGYINGHFFWGERYVPGQTPDRRRK
jgi:hypothetical protein